MIELNALTAGLLASKPQIKKHGLALQPQLLLNGPSAAIEVAGDSIELFFDGEPNENPHFAELVGRYRQSILTEADRLRSRLSDIVVFVGIWYHVDYDEEARFEPYVTYAVPAAGRPTVRAYESTIFDYDSRERLMLDPFHFKFHTIERLAADSATLANSILDQHSRGSGTSGLDRLQGVIWHLTDNVETVPFSISRICGLMPGETRAPEDAARPAPSVEEEELIEARRSFSEALSIAELGGGITPEVQAAYDALVKAEEALPEASGYSDPRWVSRCLRNSCFGVMRGHIVERGTHGGTMSLAEIADATPASGYWFQARYGKDAVPYHPAFRALEGDNSMWGIWQKIQMRLAERNEENQDAAYVSDWEQRPNGVFTRYLALGNEMKLSWEPRLTRGSASSAEDAAMRNPEPQIMDRMAFQRS